MSSINNQLTLYRFVSLRTPGLSKKEKQHERFVTHPDNENGTFLNAVRNSGEELTKWNAMQKAANSESFFQSEGEIFDFLKSIGIEKPDLYIETANWISKNRNNFNARELVEKLDQQPLIVDKQELYIWDNLFYQIITQKSFYVKEELMQILVLNNLLKHYRNYREEELITVLPIFANARVELPVKLFGAEETMQSQNAEKRKDDEFEEIDSQIADAQAIQFAKNQSENLDNLSSVLKNIENKYQKDYQTQYQAEHQRHQENIAPIVADYQRRYNAERRRMFDIVKPENYDAIDFLNLIDVEQPDLPQFTFLYQPEIDLKQLQNQLSEHQFGLLAEIVGNNQPEKFDEIQSLISQKIKIQAEIINKKTIVSEKIVSIGDAVFTKNTNNASNLELPFTVCTKRFSDGQINVFLSVQLYSTSLILNTFDSKVKFTDGTELKNNRADYLSSNNGTTLTLSNLFGTRLNYPSNISTFIGKITFTNGQYYTFAIPNFTLLTECVNAKMIPIDIYDSEEPTDPTNPQNNSFIPKGFGYKQLGIAEYKKVVSEVCCYHAGEVAHIENVMASELRSKTTTKTFKSEVTDSESTETEKENMTDLVSTERFEMQTEIATMMNEETQASMYANIKTSWPSTTLDAGGAYANNTSKQESNRQAVNQGKEITQRATERIVSRSKKEKTIKVTNEFTEVNDHTFDNRGSREHISGVFRFINAEYKNQIHNYGKRLMYEFTVPQPSKLHELAMQVSATTENAVELSKPIHPSTIEISDFNSINENNYQNLAASYNATVDIFPSKTLVIGASFDYSSQVSNTASAKKDVIKIKDNRYQAIRASVIVTGTSPGGYTGWGTGVVISVGNQRFDFNPNTQVIQPQVGQPIPYYTDEIPFAFWTTNVHAVNILVNIDCQLTNEALIAWKKSTYEKIVAGYEEQMRIFNEKLSQAKSDGVKILDSNPLFYREIEKTVLRKNCISYLMDNSVSS